MKYIMLVYQGTALERQAALPEEARRHSPLTLAPG